MKDDELNDDDKALFEGLRRLGVPLSGADPMSAWWAVLTVALALMFLYVFAGK